MTLVALIRHAPTAWNAEGRIQGRTDIGLSDEGRAMAREWVVPAALAGFDWVASPLMRARETAAMLGAANCRTDPRLAEANWGEWEGQVLAELRATLKGALEREEAKGLDLQVPGGESPRDVRDRLAGWLAEVEAAARPTVAVTHNGVIRAAYSLATGWDMTTRLDVRFDWGEAQLFDVTGGVLRIRALNLSLRETA
jgi:broad specificity phosphatase PhoE